MRRQLEAVESGKDLRDVIVEMGPKGIGDFLKAGAGFRVRAAGKDLTAEPIGGDARRYRLSGTDMVAEVGLEVGPDLAVAVQSVTLTNEGAQPAPPINLLDAMFLATRVRLKDLPRACGFGGGLTDGFYPPAAYRPEELVFGKGRDWDPADSAFHRWWTTKRRFTLESGPTGRSSNPHLPLMHFAWQSPAGLIGLWTALEWSGRWEIQLGTEAEWTFIFRAGPKVDGMVLAPGETVRLPRVHVGVYAGTMDDGFNSVRRYVAEVLSPDVEGDRPRAFVAYHHWFGIHEDFDEALMRRQVDRAAELGLEYFEVDAAWYDAGGGRFWEGVGNWQRVAPAKFADGLEPFAEYVRSKGLRFGLWFEPERARRDSDWGREHRDWYWWQEGNPSGHLDLTRREVQDGLIAMLSDWIARLDIRWLRWDCNHAPGPFWDQVDPTGKVQFAYVEGLYRVFDTLLDRHANLMIDNCAGGGQRVDFGTLRRAGTMVISDHGDDPHICRIMQTGGARVLPGNYMNSSIYLGPGDGDASVGPLELISRMAGAISLSGHIANWSKRHTRRVRRHLDGLRSYRHLLMKDFHPLTAYPRTPADWDVVEFVDPDTREAVVLAYRVRGDERARTVHPVRLDPQADYEITDPFSARKPRTAAGQALMGRGLRLSLAPESAAVRHLKPAGTHPG
ncbi:MAG: alpha-galactosidase [Planctomycetota bacterium]|jgi:alpha-galactosidase